MADEFDEATLRTFSPEEVAAIQARDAARLGEVSGDEQLRIARQKVREALRKKYPLPKEGFYSVETLGGGDAGLAAYLEIAVNAYGFDPTGDYRPPLDPLPKDSGPPAQVLGMGKNTFGNKSLEKL